MPTRNVVITDKQAEMIDRLVATGRYQNASEVLREGLRLVEGRDLEEKARLKALREAAKLGIADMDAGRYYTFDKPGMLSEHVAAVVDDVTAARRNRRAK